MSSWEFRSFDGALQNANVWHKAIMGRKGTVGAEAERKGKARPIDPRLEATVAAWRWVADRLSGSHNDQERRR